MFLKNFWWSACAKSRLSGKRLIKVIVSSVHLNLKMSIPILIKFIFCFQSSGQEKTIFFLGAKPGDKNYLQTNGVFLC